MTKLQWVVGLLAAGGAIAFGQAPKEPAPAKAGARDNGIELAGERVVKGDIAGALVLLQSAERGNPLLPPARVMLARLCFNMPGPVR